jgi:heterodisulfide reductase subunit B
MKEELCPECEMEIDEDEFEVEKFRCPRCGKIFELAVWKGEANKKEISDKELLDFLSNLKNEVSSSKFWDEYDYFPSPELIAEFVVNYLIEKMKEKLKEKGGDWDDKR